MLKPFPSTFMYFIHRPTIPHIFIHRLPFHPQSPIFSHSYTDGMPTGSLLIWKRYQRSANIRKRHWRSAKRIPSDPKTLLKEWEQNPLLSENVTDGVPTRSFLIQKTLLTWQIISIGKQFDLIWLGYQAYNLQTIQMRCEGRANVAISARGWKTSWTGWAEADWLLTSTPATMDSRKLSAGKRA